MAVLMIRLVWYGEASDQGVEFMSCLSCFCVGSSDQATWWVWRL